MPEHGCRKLTSHRKATKQPLESHNQMRDNHGIFTFTELAAESVLGLFDCVFGN